MLELRWLERATRSALDDAISARPTSTSCPGSATAPTTSAPRAHPGAGARARRPNEVTGEELGALLQDERSLRRVVLNSLRGARTSARSPASPLAYSLVEYGVPAVVGMRFEISDEAAITFAGRLYNVIALGFSIDAAMAAVASDAQAVVKLNRNQTPTTAA